MPELSVVVFAAENDQRAVLQVLVDGTSVARTVSSSGALPVSVSDPVLRKLHAHTPHVILVDIPAGADEAALRAIELLHQEFPDAAVFAVFIGALFTNCFDSLYLLS